MTRKTIIEFPFSTAGQAVGFVVSVAVAAYIVSWAQQRIAARRMTAAATPGA